MTVIQGSIGLAVLVGLAWLVSENRARLPWRTVPVGIAIQFVLALLLLKWSAGWQLLLALNGVVEALQAATRAGTSFVFGYIGGGALPFDEKTPGGAFILASQALPLVLLVSALSALLYHWRVLPAVVGAFAGRSRASLGSAARRAFRPPPTYSSAWSNRRSRSAPI